MASGNNWLGFSLSGQENPQPHQDSSPPARISISGASDFYGLPTQPGPDAQLGVTGHHPSYGIMEAFNRGAHETQGERKKLASLKVSCYLMLSIYLVCMFKVS